MRYCELDPYFVRFKKSEFVRLSEMKNDQSEKLLLKLLTVLLDRLLTVVLEDGGKRVRVDWTVQAVVY